VPTADESLVTHRLAANLSLSCVSESRLTANPFRYVYRAVWPDTLYRFSFKLPLQFMERQFKAVSADSLFVIIFIANQQ
jgi:hypothetical protein